MLARCAAPAKLWCVGEDFPPGGKVGEVVEHMVVQQQPDCTIYSCCDRLPACDFCKRTGVTTIQHVTLDLSSFAAVTKACCDCKAQTARRVRCDACQDKMDASRAGTKLTAEQVGEKLDEYVRQSDESYSKLQLCVKGAAYERLANSDPTRNDKPPYPAARVALCSLLDGKKNWVDPDSLGENLDRITEELATQRGLAAGDALDLEAFKSAVEVWGSKEGKDISVLMPGVGWIWGEGH